MQRFRSLSGIKLKISDESWQTGQTESTPLLVGSGMSTQLIPWGKRKVMLMFAMGQEDSYLCSKCQLIE